MGYSWDGEVVGSGSIRITDEREPDHIQYDLQFLRPFKSFSKVSFELAVRYRGTEVTWTMNGSLPWFLFFMTRMMSHFIGMDYERGLKMLKDHAEQGEVPCHLEFSGVQSFQGFRYVGLRKQCLIADIQEAMGRDVDELKRLIARHAVSVSGPPFCQYLKWGLGGGMCSYVIGYPVSGGMAKVPAELEEGNLPDVSTYRVRMKGPYRHLGNAWAAGMMHGRAWKYQKRNNVAPFEIYETDHETVEENEIVTMVHFPCR